MQIGKLDPLKTICDLKWNYPIFMFNRSEFRSCCRTTANKITDKDLKEKGIEAFLNSDEMIKSRYDLVRGIRSTDCRTCWAIEDTGAASPRSHPREFWKHLETAGQLPTNAQATKAGMLKILSDIDSVAHPMLRSYHPKMVEISLGNTCDMKCMYCSHHYSTQWAAERIKHGEITQDQYDLEFPPPSDLFVQKFWEWFNEVGRYTIERLGIIGGEPLIIPEFYNFIDKIIESVNEIKDKRSNKLHIWIVTNLNTPPQYLEKFIQYLPKITENFNLDILVSMESLDKKAEYIRNGVNWTRFDNNVKTILNRKDLKYNFGFILSQNILSISSIKDVIKHIENLYFTYNRPISIKQSIVSHPTWQNPTILTPDFADYIDDAIAYMKTNVGKMPIVEDYYGRYDQYIHFLSKLSTGIRHNKADVAAERKQFVSWFETYDQRRNLNLLETFPEYTEFWNLCKKSLGD